MKRIVIECLVILLVLLFCSLYGAVTVRDVRHPVQTIQSAREFNDRETSQTIVIPEKQSSPVSPETNRQSGALPKNSTSDVFSEHVQRFFLQGVSAVAEFVGGLIKAF
ncbi:hypothetical protein M3N64_00495 [Sporolactobacillus sp. CPB3-1]|uniref:DUF3679 domain-containing protein n=1 Tax=Sporolactobacillus mangiferae TaxID=2940498 RepID=A0ABT0M6D8_9BACL|nr:hypothetical protein [Sporolactobacillus mangiferae]MCL1630431.1 hypothetical protein [Sporolactobacillus mangiferae]